MPFVKAKCTNCGGSLQVDSEKKAAICPFCNQAYVVEDAINNYITNIHANVVNITDDRSANARIKAAEAFLKLGEWDKANQSYIEVCDLTPQDYRGWWGRIQALTHDFSPFQCAVDAGSIYACEQWVKDLKKLFASAVTFMPEDKRATSEELFQSYLSNVQQCIDAAKKQNAARCSTLQKKIRQTQNERAEALSQLEKWESTPIKSTGRERSSGGGGGIGCFGWLLLGWFIFIIPVILITALVESDLPKIAKIGIPVAAVALGIAILMLVRVRRNAAKAANAERESSIVKYRSEAEQKAKQLQQLQAELSRLTSNAAVADFDPFQPR